MADGSGEDPSIAVYLGYGVLFAVVLGAVALLVQWYVVSDSRRFVAQQAGLLTHSSIFWSRWSYEQLWTAPYGDLAAESDRCGRIIDNLLSRRGPSNSRGRGRESAEYDYYDREITRYRQMQTAVQNAMNYVAGRGRDPQQPPYST